MSHRGQIIQRAIYNSGLSITKLAKKLNKSRGWVYLMFENENVNFATVLEIGKIIHHDFSDEIEDLIIFKSNTSDRFENTNNQSDISWEEKYIILLEKYIKLLKTKS
ncbi:hypothetical protein [uncultured Flavobacterium sp.]|uniref:hypothetical protein n=1 Tax=uncultured Flavobacterium sp. TaxID=165435 RepID=UPI0030CA2301